MQAQIAVILFMNIVISGLGALLMPHFTNNRKLQKKEKYFPDYNHYHNLSQIYSHISEIVSQNPFYMHLDHSYKSRQGYSQLLVHIANFSDIRVQMNNNKPFWIPPKLKILLSYGEHAREFFPVESLFYFLTNLTRGLSSHRNNPEEIFSRYILSNVDLFIVTMMNPDGRRHIEETQNYCWRGTSKGVDINRNFDWNFGGEGSSTKIGTEELRGNKPFSEPECQVLIQLTKKYRFDAFISFHSGIREIYLPFADSISKKIHRKPENLESMMDLAKRMAEVMNPHFLYGQASHIIHYPADGTVFDYMAGIRKIPFSYAIELWGEGDQPGMHCFDLFNPSNNNLEESLTLVHPLYEQLFGYLIEWKEKELKNTTMIEINGLSFIVCFITLGFVFLLICIASCNHRIPKWIRPYPRRRIISLKSLGSTLHPHSSVRIEEPCPKPLKLQVPAQSATGPVGTTLLVSQHQLKLLKASLAHHM